MKLRQLFEALNNEVAIIFGRFNPPHKGHRAAWELASKSPVWYVGTNENTVGPKDPLPFDVKVEAMKTVWPDVAGHIVAEQSWLTLASRAYGQKPNATLLCLTDEDWVTKTIQQYNGKEGPHGFYNFKKIEQNPTPRLSSATALRAAVQAGDRDAFTQAAGVDADTPVAGKPFFDLVAEYLLPYANAPKKVAKKKKEPNVTEAGTKPGWMLKQDSKLAAKVKAKTDLAKKRQASYGDSSAGKSVDKQGVAEGIFGLSAKEKGKIQYITSKVSDIPGYWDFEKDTFTPEGLKALTKVLGGNKRYVKYAVNLTADDYEAEGFADDFAAFAKERGGVLRHGPQARKPAAATTAHAAPPAVDREALAAELKQLQAEFDPQYQYSDDYSFWSKQHEIAQRIAYIKKQLITAEQGVAEGSKKTLRNTNPCWKGYKPVGTKKKNGRTVPNCVPIGEGWEQQLDAAVRKLFEGKK